MIEVTLYRRKDCQLCDHVMAVLHSLEQSYPHFVNVIDINTSIDLQKKYGDDIPVIIIGSFILKSTITRQELILAFNQTLENNRNFIGDKKPLSWKKTDSISYWFSRHYLFIFNMIISAFIIFPIIAPALLFWGFEKPAHIIYQIYKTTCHQLAYRSFFLFGKQAYYPRAAAGIEGVITFKEATNIGEGNSPEEIIAAREFLGNKEMGYKLALCERDMAIYFGILLFGLLLSITKRKIPSLKWYLWLLFGLVPIGVDGISQIISQPPLLFIPYRESTPLLRVITGFLFGFTTAWFGLPLVDESMQQAIQIYKDKLKKIQVTKP